jgi:uncharacterized protein YoxC
MNAGQLAALVAAAFFAVGVCVAVYALLKLAGLLTAATGFVTGMREQTDAIIEQAHAAINRTNEQLDRTDSITANMDEVSANVAELTEHVSALAGMGRALAAGPVGKASAVAYGVRHALDLRRSGAPASARVSAQRPAPQVGWQGAPGSRSVAPAAPTGSGRGAGSGANHAGGSSAAARAMALREARSAAVRKAGSLAVRGVGLAGRSLAARASGRAAR